MMPPPPSEKKKKKRMKKSRQIALLITTTQKNEQKSPEKTYSTRWVLYVLVFECLNLNWISIEEILF